MKAIYIIFISYVDIEAIIWISGLLFLAFIPPVKSAHFTFCPLKNLGFEFCPGCGLGCSISYLFRLNFKLSFQAHPLGLPALLILLHRISVLLKKSFFRCYIDLQTTKPKWGE